MSRNCSSDVEEIRKEINKYIENIIEHVMDMAKHYEGVTIDNLIMFSKLYITLKSITHDPSLFNELANLLPQSLGWKSESRIHDTALTIELSLDRDFFNRISKSRKLTVQHVLGKHPSQRDLLGYIFCRKAGILKKHSNGTLRVDLDSLRSIMGTEVKIGFSDIAKYLNEIPSNLWPKILSREVFRKLDVEGLLELANRYQGRNVTIDNRLIDEFKYRIRTGWKPSVNEARKIEKLLDKILDPQDLVENPHLISFLDHNEVSSFIENAEPKKLANKIEQLPLRERLKVVNSISRTKKGEEVLKLLNPISLSGITNPEKYSDDIKAKALLGKSLIHYIDYLLTKNTSYLNYSMYFLERVSPDELDYEFKPIYTSMIKGDKKAFIAFMGRVIPFDSIEIISQRLTENYYQKGYIDPDVLKRAIALGLRILQNMRGFKGTLIFNKKKDIARGRLDIRKTIYNNVRLNNKLVFKNYDKKYLVVAVVDTSGSMAKFSLWSILSLATIVKLVSSVILFSENVKVFMFPKKIFQQKLLAKYLENLFSEGFKGYTNISLALREALRIAKITGSRVLVLFSDLQQTVQDQKPWEIAKDAVNRGYKVFVITHREHDREAYRKFVEAGCKVTMVDNPKDIPNILKRSIYL
ncbi:MAG: VWA domain-containing protein [Desulfurococcaceae archaeon]